MAVVLMSPQVSRILVPVDFSHHAAAAVEYAGLIGSAFRASVTLIHFCEMPNAMVGIVPGASVEGDLAAERRAAENLLRPLAESLRKDVPSVEIRIETNIASSYAAAILSTAAAGSFDLIVMGTHGRRGLDHLLMGSVAEGVSRSARCPVLTVRLPSES